MQSEEELERLRYFLCSSAGGSLDHLRETKFKGLLPSKPLEPSSLKAELERILDFVKNRNWKISLFHVDISDIVKSLTLQGFNLDSLRIFMDLSKLLGSMLSSNGRLLITASGQFLIILYSIASYTEDLLAHQISFALKDFYETSIPMEIKVLSSFVYPDQGENLFDFLKSINVQT